MSKPSITKVFIVDDHELVRQGLRQLIDGEVDLTLCGEASSVDEALKMRPFLNPDVAIVDISLPDGNGLDLIKQFHYWKPQMQIIALSMHDDELYAERAINNGASGYINKQDSAQKLLLGIREVVKSQIFVKPEIAENLLNQQFQSNYLLYDKNNILTKLTDRELQVFDLISKGIKTKDIANNLKLSVKTIETHRRHIKDKLSLTSGTQLIRAAIMWALEKD
ncbi:response regulator transcription factor [Colwellia sp. MB02u-14]|uniref:response regulator n=1 Tax=Colwellia sp. MB02u-14 TaxID=2759815 RepID=UPI0015F4A405|nr:response regulator transcription factor [Colwellia sp. MB02u-14]MBA6304444.1 response regulator transcription factor [Colwellia sp. MB02u-14]